jgi:hypothetical protein
MTVLSIIGAALVLCAFVMSNLGRMNPGSMTYAFLNFAGTGLLAVTLISPLNIGAFAVEFVWCVFSAYLMVRCWFRSRRDRA